jgi:hypothetical protein
MAVVAMIAAAVRLPSAVAAAVRCLRRRCCAGSRRRPRLRSSMLLRHLPLRLHVLLRLGPVFHSRLRLGAILHSRLRLRLRTVFYAWLWL